MFSSTQSSFIRILNLEDNTEGTVRKMQFLIKDFFSKCDQIRISCRSHLLKNSLMEDFIFLCSKDQDERFLFNCQKPSSGGVLKGFKIFTGKHLSQGLFFNKVADLRPAYLLIKRLQSLFFNKVAGLRPEFLIKQRL